MVDQISDYHAHIYFDPDEADEARQFGEAMLARFPELGMGRVHTKPVGPHPRGSCQLTVPTAFAGEVLAWFVLKRGRFTIFMHANTGDDLADHTAHVIWLGPSETLDLTDFLPGA